MIDTSKLLRTLLATLIAGFGAAAAAGDVVLYRQGETPAPEDIARILKGGAAPVVKTRGIKLLADEAARPAAVPEKDLERAAAAVAAAAPSREATAFALQIQFPFDSAQIQPEMVDPLDAVAEGIKLSGAQIRIVIEGHTDASGPVDYNLLLSRRRAEAVKNYLVGRHGLPPANFKVVGRGKFEPLLRDDPFAPENRRVQFRPDGA
jgi:outer membrane protein OmpA-like peptidoglycan-associated protein